MAIIINGVRNPGEWSLATRLDAAATSPAGYSLYGTIDGDAFAFSLQSATAIGSGTTIWLNTDNNNNTGYQIFGNQTGADFNINFIDDAGAVVPRLYTGASGEVLKDATIAYAFSADKQSVEFKIPFSVLGLSTTPAVTDVYADVNNIVFLPGNYSLPGLELINPATLPARTDFNLKVGIVYSETTASKFFDKTAYSDLFMVAQNQATMAGVPYDILTEDDLTNLGKLINYDTLIFPSFANVPLARLDAIQNALTTVVTKYGIGLITAGNFMTNDEIGTALPGDPYARMSTLLGIQRQGGAESADIRVAATDVSHPAMQGYVAGETIRDYTAVNTQWFTPVTSNFSVLADQLVAGQAYNAVLATTTGGKNVHFATVGMLADNNMLAHALDWTANDVTQPSLQLHMSRQTALFASRSDLDQAMVPTEVNPASGPGIYDVMLPILQQWKQDFNFVGSYYIDIGDGTNGTGTDWSISKPYLDQLLAMGNEIGSHSITHPADTNLLTAEQLQLEFQQSKSIIEQNLGITVFGAAIPGAPEKLPVSEALMSYYSYVTGGNTAVGAGYPGAFGYMTPGDNGKVYLAPNISSDFSLIGFKQMTTAQATAAWLSEWQAMTAHAELPVIVWPWHDYGLTGRDPSTIQYTQQMYTDFIRTAYQAGSEFVTLADLAQRIVAFEKAALNYQMVDTDTLTVTIGSVGKLGTFALDLEGQRIKNAGGWYAFDDDSLFLPESGGNFTVDLGPTPDDVTHITALPSRAKLLSVSGDGKILDFSVVGEGKVVIDLAQYGSQTVTAAGATIASLVGERLELALTGAGQHDVSVRLLTPSSEPAPTFSVFRDGVSSQDVAVAYPADGPVKTLQFQYLGTASGEVVIGTASNDFINLLGGDDAASGAGGNDVLDGGLGSNFLTGGAGSDVFFLDGRTGQTTWSTIADWETGEQLSLWGWRPGVSKATWADTAGASGYQGVTMYGDLDGDEVVDTSVTWTGQTRAQLPTALEFDGLLWFT